jgi:hypothetical protein
MNKKQFKNNSNLHSSSDQANSNNMKLDALFSEKLKEANETLKRIGLPNQEVK